MSKQNRKTLAEIISGIQSKDPRFYVNGLGYTYQPKEPLVLLGSKSGTATTGIRLTASYRTGSSTASATFVTGGDSKANFSISYLLGGAETSNSIELKLESSSDGSNWYQIVNESVSGATSTLTQREFTFVGANTAAAYNFSLPLDLQDKWMRISIKESGVASNFGTAYVEVMLSGEK